MPSHRGPGRDGSAAPTTSARHPKVIQKVRKGRRVTGLPGADELDHRLAVTVDEVVNLCRQAATRTADRMDRRLYPRIRVVRPSPLCGG
jgi:ABC-type Mn2+/Zn2+ transport system ATPase subunit